MKLFFRFLGLAFIATIVCVSTIAVFGSHLFTFGVSGSGSIESEVRDLEPFDKISLTELGTINIRFGETQSVTLTTDENLLELVETIIVDGKLVIQPSETISPSDDLVIDIVLPAISEVKLTGVAVVNIENIDAESLKISLVGNSGVTADGKVTDLNVDLVGASRASLKELKSKNATVSITGSGSAYVTATDSIDADATGFASITCYGNPSKIKEQTKGMSRITISD